MRSVRTRQQFARRLTRRAALVAPVFCPIQKLGAVLSRLLIPAFAFFLRCSSSVTPNVSNRRIRTRTHGGVAGVGGRPPPLCRSSRLVFTNGDGVAHLTYYRETGDMRHHHRRLHEVLCRI